MTTATVERIAPHIEVASEVVDAPKLAIAEYNPTQAALLELKNMFRGVVFEVHTADGMKDAKDAAKRLTKLRTSLEAKRKEIKEPALRRSQAIDSEAKTLTAEIISLENPIKEQIRLQEEKEAREEAERQRIERERVEGIKRRIEEIRAIPVASANDSTADLKATLDDIEGFVISDEDGFAEFIAEARAARDETLFKLTTMHDASVARDAERAELARLRAEQAARDEEARLAKEELDRKVAEFERQKAEFEAMMAAAQAKPVAATIVEQEPAPVESRIVFVDDEPAPLPRPVAAPIEVIDQFVDEAPEDDTEALTPVADEPRTPDVTKVSAASQFPGQLPTGYWMDGEYWGPTPAGTDDMAREFAGQTIKLVPFWSHNQEVRFSVGIEGGELIYAAVQEDAPLLVANLFDVVA